MLSQVEQEVTHTHSLSHTHTLTLHTNMVKRKRLEVKEEAQRPRSISAASGNNLCWKHQQPLTVFCHTDRKVLCDGCVPAEHGGHTIGLVGEERRRRQEELQKMKTRTGKLLQKQETRLRNEGLILDQIREAATETEEYCEKILVGAIDLLQRRFLSVKTLIGDREASAAAQVQVSQRSLRTKMEGVRKREAELDRLAQIDSDACFMQEWSSVQGHCSEDPPLGGAPTDPLQPFRSIKSTFKRLGRQLEDLCDKEFAPTPQTAPHPRSSDSDESEEELDGDTTEDSEEEEDARPERGDQSHGVCGGKKTTAEPTTRAEFLKYACEVTLDAATAHKDLLLSRDDKEVRMCAQKGQGSADRLPERFTNRRHVLCREGLQAERCYYEVEVSGGKAEVALAYKSIDRKSLRPHSAFGGGANSWSLDRSSTYSVSHKSDSVQLTVSPSCKRIGVYLKFREGTLSFYEVAERMTFLYEMKAQFAEPLYPGFWLGDKCCIQICDLHRDAS